MQWGQEGLCLKPKGLTRVPLGASMPSDNKGLDNEATSA